jgi:hypothetical protein
MCSRLARLFWKALDRGDHVVMFARCWAVDLLYGPAPPTPTDETREADHKRLRKAFPGIDLDKTKAIAGEGQQVQVTPTAPVTASDEAPPRGVGSSSRTLNTPSAASTLYPTHQRATKAPARVGSRK